MTIDTALGSQLDDMADSVNLAAKKRMQRILSSLHPSNENSASVTTLRGGGRQWEIPRSPPRRMEILRPLPATSACGLVILMGSAGPSGRCVHQGVCSCRCVVEGVDVCLSVLVAVILPTHSCIVQYVTGRRRCFRLQSGRSLLRRPVIFPPCAIFFKSRVNIQTLPFCIHLVAGSTLGYNTYMMQMQTQRMCNKKHDVTQTNQRRCPDGAFPVLWFHLGSHRSWEQGGYGFCRRECAAAGAVTVVHRASCANQYPAGC